MSSLLLRVDSLTNTKVKAQEGCTQHCKQCLIKLNILLDCSPFMNFVLWHPRMGTLGRATVSRACGQVQR
jgi:hypothetical protein